jgi:hypothetical protein
LTGSTKAIKNPEVLTTSPKNSHVIALPSMISIVSPKKEVTQHRGKFKSPVTFYHLNSLKRTKINQGSNK